MPKPRAKTVGARVTTEQYQQLEAMAHDQGRTLSEWSRDVLLEELKPRRRNTAELRYLGILKRELYELAEEIQPLLPEIMALRVIVINLMAGLIRGDQMTKEGVDQLVRYADTERFRRAGEKRKEAASARRALRNV